MLALGLSALADRAAAFCGCFTALLQTASSFVDDLQPVSSYEAESSVASGCNVCLL